MTTTVRPGISDYHANINVEMNYWPAESTNLGECHTPFFDLMQSQGGIMAQNQRALARVENSPCGAMTARGFALRTSHNITGGMGWKWDKTANAWYCSHLWERYAFGGDQTFLRNTAYPIMKEVCQFWEDHLKELPDGKLVVPNGWSPEHGPEEDGVEITTRKLSGTCSTIMSGPAMSLALTNGNYRAKIAGMRDRLAAPGTGSWGQLLEWLTEKKDRRYPELDTTNDHHRQPPPHLFAVYPGHQITLAQTPALAAAAKISLDARGTAADSDVREWSLAWRTALYARLHDAAERASHAPAIIFRAATVRPIFLASIPPCNWMEISVSRRGSRRCFCRATKGKSICFRRCPPPGPTRVGQRRLACPRRLRGGHGLAARPIDRGHHPQHSRPTVPKSAPAIRRLILTSARAKHSGWMRLCDG